MELFKQTTVVYVDANGKRVQSTTPGASKRTIESKKWYATIKNEYGKRVNFPLSTDKRAAQALLERVLSKIERKKAGVQTIDEIEKAVQPIDPLVDSYEAYLKGKGNAASYIETAMIRLRETVKQCRFRELQDIDADIFTKWLAEKVKADGLSQQTAIYYRSHFKSFVRWLIKSRKLGHDPLVTIQVQSKVTERVMCRRALSNDEVAKLLKTTKESGVIFRYLDGNSRHSLYAAALATGLRAGALASLRVGDFDLDSELPTLVLSIKRDKSRRGKKQPIPSSYVPILRKYFKGKKNDELAWPGTWSKRAADMVRDDATAAGLTLDFPGVDGPERLDFHALRHTYLTELGLSGVDLRTAQELAGHSTPTLTAKYSHRRLQDLAGAAEKLKLPELTPEKKTSRKKKTD